jgi:acyl dehydratase
MSGITSETAVCFFEDAKVGYQTCGFDYKLTRKNIIAFANEWDPMPFHTDEKAATNSHFKGLTASGAHLYAIFVKLAHKQPRKMAALAALGIKELNFHQAARPGDTLYLKGRCIEHRESKSKSDRGIATFRFELINQEDDIILSLEQPLLLAKKSTGFSNFSTIG